MERKRIRSGEKRKLIDVQPATILPHMDLSVICQQNCSEKCVHYQETDATTQPSERSHRNHKSLLDVFHETDSTTNTVYKVMSLFSIRKIHILK